MLTVLGVVGAVLGAEAFVGEGFVRVEHHVQDVFAAGESQGGHFTTVPGRERSDLLQLSPEFGIDLTFSFFLSRLAGLQSFKSSRLKKQNEN